MLFQLLQLLAISAVPATKELANLISGWKVMWGKRVIFVPFHSAYSKSQQENTSSIQPPRWTNFK